MRRLLLIPLLAWACDDGPSAPPAIKDPGPAIDASAPPPDASTVPPPPPLTWTVQVSPSAPAAVDLAAVDLADYLGRMGLDVALSRLGGPVPCREGEGVVALLGDGLGAPRLPEETSDQSWRVENLACAGGRVVLLHGGGLLGRQYAAYAWLHALGVRFFHPEQEYVPRAPRWPDPPMDRTHTPPFLLRSVSLHLTHPLELGDPIRRRDPAHLDEVKRYIDWGLKNFASDGLGGLADTALHGYGLSRGFPLGAGFSLYNQQQGASNVIDPDDPRDDEAQIADAIDARMDLPERQPDIFSFTFNPSEFTEIDDRTVVRQLTFIAEHFAEHYPETLLFATNHGTHGEPTEHYGVRYYDLPQFAPENLGVKVHPLMFYDLERPAPVYGNTDFGFLFDFMEREHLRRNLIYFPEAAWWLTFDIAVPLYLPITIEARSRDLERLAFMLDGKLVGHRVFGTGHEWGYWQNEYCSYRMAADLAYRWRDCLADIVSPFGGAAAGTQAVLEAQIALQAPLFTDARLLAYLVGTDPETEAAAAVGVVFHPLPPGPAEIARWDLDRIAAWRAEVAAPLQASLDAHYDLVARLEDLGPAVPEDGAPWFDEIADGIMANTLRIQHQLMVYDALVTRREARLSGRPDRHARAEALLEVARATTEAVSALIGQREAGYRYAPLERAIGGGPDLDDDDNWTIYPYRYLARTHHAYYYRRIDALAEAAFADPDAPVVIADVVLGPGEPLRIGVNEALPGLRIELGDGAEADGPVDHHYAAPGLYTVRISGAGLELMAEVAALAEVHLAGPAAVVEDPPTVQIIAGLMPALTLGPVDAETMVVGFGAEAGGPVGVGEMVALARAPGAPGLQSLPTRLEVPIVNRGDGQVIARIEVRDAVVTLEGAEAPARVAGDLSTQAIIDALVGVGGFEPDGARQLVASLLGFTPDSLPDSVTFVVAFERVRP